MCVFCCPCTCLMYLMLCGNALCCSIMYLMLCVNALCCSIKRLIGRQFSDKTVQHDKKLLPYSIVSKEVSLCLSVLLFVCFVLSLCSVRLSVFFLSNLDAFGVCYVAVRTNSLHWVLSFANSLAACRLCVSASVRPRPCL